MDLLTTDPEQCSAGGRTDEALAAHHFHVLDFESIRAQQESVGRAKSSRQTFH